jgi:hypothetical protein
MKTVHRPGENYLCPVEKGIQPEPWFASPEFALHPCVLNKNYFIAGYSA